MDSALKAVSGALSVSNANAFERLILRSENKCYYWKIDVFFLKYFTLNTKYLCALSCLEIIASCALFIKKFLSF